jgi:two-component system response regulator YesN
MMDADDEKLPHNVNYSRLVLDVMNYISTNYNKVDLDLLEIAAHIRLSTAHLGVLFKQETGITIKHYMSTYRMEHAKKLVAQDQMKMNKIAELCGYASASYFAKVFKAFTDHSPIEYRRQKEKSI